MPKVSLICTVFNEASSIDELFESILNQERKPDELVIVDGGSVDGTWEKILAWKKKFEKAGIAFKPIQAKGANIAQGRNIAIKNASFELIASIDGGCIADRAWLKELLKAYKPGHVVSGNFKPIARNFAEKVQAVFVKVSARDNPSSRSVLFEKEAWKKVGGYPEHLYTGEDTLFNARLKQAGYTFIFAEKAVVYWRMRKNFWKWLKQFYRYGVGDGEALNIDPKTTYGRKLLALLLTFYIFLALLPRFPWLLALPFLAGMAYGLKRSFSIYGFVGGLLLPIRYLAFILGFHVGLARRVVKGLK